MKRYIVAGASALALAALSTPAVAATDNAVTSTRVAPGDECGTAVITWENPTEWKFFGDYRIGDEQGTPADPELPATIPEGPLAGEPYGPTYHLTDVPAGETVTETVTVPDGTEPVTVSAWIKRGPENHSYSVAAPVNITPCAPETTEPTDPPQTTEPSSPAPTTPGDEDDTSDDDVEQVGDEPDEDGTAPTPTPQEGHIAVTG